MSGMRKDAGTYEKADILCFFNVANVLGSDLLSKVINRGYLLIASEFVDGATKLDSEQIW